MPTDTRGSREAREGPEGVALRLWRERPRPRRGRVPLTGPPASARRCKQSVRLETHTINCPLMCGSGCHGLNQHSIFILF